MMRRQCTTSGCVRTATYTNVYWVQGVQVHQHVCVVCADQLAQHGVTDVSVSLREHGADYGAMQAWTVSA